MTNPVVASVARRWEPGRVLVEAAEQVARASYDLAVRFHRGGTLIALGTGQGAADAAHLAVAFAHPDVVGRRSLPAVALADDPTAPVTGQVRLLGGPDNIAVGVATGEPATRGSATGEPATAIGPALATARELGMLTVALTTGQVEADHVLTAHTTDPCVASEIHITTCHVLSDLVHMFLSRPALLEVSP